MRSEDDTASVCTDQAQRDEHLEIKDLLKVQTHPRTVFTTRSATRTGDRGLSNPCVSNPSA